MIERKFWFVTGASRRRDEDRAAAEPSHIHVPRRRRVTRPAAAGATVTWGARGDHEAYGTPPVDAPVDTAVDRSPAEA
jgi:hypothetical protein